MEESSAVFEAFCSAPPSYEQWMERRGVVDGSSIKYYNSNPKLQPPERFFVLERELERSYCGGAFLSCIFLAATVVDLLFKDLNKKGRDCLDKDLEYVASELELLRSMRNRISHYLSGGESFSMNKYVFSNGELEFSARQGIAAVYHVARAYGRLDPELVLKGTRRDPERQDTGARSD